MATDPRSPMAASAVAPEAAEAPASMDVAQAVTTNGAPSIATSSDALGQVGSICRYLRHMDGAYRALGASRDHRCWAVEPPSSIPAATQVDLCLVASHGRCERYVDAQERRTAGLATDHIPSHLVTSPRFAIPVDPVPVVVDARVGGRDQGGMTPVADVMARRRLPAIAALVGILVVGVVGLGALFGGMGGQPAPTPPLAAAAGSTTPTSGPTAPPARTAAPTPAATPAPTSDGGPEATDAAVVPQADPTPTPEPSYPVEIRRRYLVKEGDTYRTLARRFGLKPRDLRALNGRLRVGERILIPARPWVTDAPGE